jgi:acetyl-CoA acetyltransferase
VTGGFVPGAYAIAGVGETAVGVLPDRTTTGLALDAMRAAILDAGLTVDEVDGIVCDQPANAPQRSYALALARTLGVHPHYATDLALGGASPAASVIHAILAIGAGLAHTVVCVHTQKQATGRAEARRGRLFDGLEDYEEPFGLTSAVSQHATVAARHMHEFGTTSEQLAAVAVAFRKHAALNPAATMRTPITIADVLSSRWITKPLHLLDCCLVSDGAGAVVVTASERAQTLRKPPVFVAGFGLGYTAGPLENPTLTTLGGAESSATAYRMSGLRPSDVDFAELYDCFTIIPLVTLEDYGFCAKGEGGAFVSAGRIELDGELPVNTHGGLLSHGHVEGMQHLTEAVKQLRGGEVEPERQVARARVGIVSGHGAMLSAHATLILTKEQP